MKPERPDPGAAAVPPALPAFDAADRGVEPDPRLDRWLLDAAPDLPAGFTARVLAALPERSPAQQMSAGTVALPPSRWPRLRALALAAGGLLGLAQVLAFLLGIWSSTQAG